MPNANDDLLGKAGQRGSARVQMRQPTREATRDGTFIGRNNEQLTRHRVNGIDQFEIPPELVPQGWSYQWNAVSVYNNADLTRSQNMQMYANGWRPVPADRHPGRWTPLGKSGDIVVDGQRLEERPLAMTEQAREEDIAVAKRQMRDRDQALMGGPARLGAAMQNGLEARATLDGGRALKMSIDPALDIDKPSYQPADDSRP